MQAYGMKSNVRLAFSIENEYTRQIAGNISELRQKTFV